MTGTIWLTVSKDCWVINWIDEFLIVLWSFDGLKDYTANSALTRYSFILGVSRAWYALFLFLVILHCTIFYSIRLHVSYRFTNV